MASGVKWELECAKTWEEAKQLAAEGWELVSVKAIGDHGRWWFKRELKK